MWNLCHQKEMAFSPPHQGKTDNAIMWLQCLNIQIHLTEYLKCPFKHPSAKLCFSSFLSWIQGKFSHCAAQLCQWSTHITTVLSFFKRTSYKSIGSLQFPYLVLCYGWRLLQNFFHCLYDSLCSHNTDRANQVDQQKLLFTCCRNNLKESHVCHRLSPQWLCKN